MTTSTDIVRFFQRQEAGRQFSAGEVQRLGGFAASNNVYGALAIIAQPGGPLVRERDNGIFQYRIRPNFDVAAWLSKIESQPKRMTPDIPSFTDNKTAAPQPSTSTLLTAPSGEGVGKGEAAAGAVNEPAETAPARTGEGQGAVPPAPLSPAGTESAAAKPTLKAAPSKEGAEISLVADPLGMGKVYALALADLKARRQQLDNAIEFIESIVKGGAST